MSLPSANWVVFWLVLLHELDLAGGQAEPSEVVPRIRQYFPNVTDEDVRRRNRSGLNQWDNRIRWVRQWLVIHGCVDGSTRGIWRIAPLGKKWLDQNWRGPGVDYSHVTKPPSVAAAGKVTDDDELGTGRSPTDGKVAAEVSPVLSRVPRLRKILLGAMLGDGDFSALELYLLAVMSYELELHDEASALFDRALSGSLEPAFRAKAETMRSISFEKLREEAEGRIVRARGRIKALLEGPLGPCELSEIQGLADVIGRLSKPALREDVR